ncbi:MAG TPA: APC family permease, partial [Gemmatimonadales bacterium]|nr:APC family permease [Gemmatimonadales bacterium]
MTTPAPARHDAEQSLERAIGPWALGANVLNLTIGAGIFALPAAVAIILGPAAVLAYLVCGALILLVLTCFVEIGTRVTRSGGAVTYIEEAFGPMAGFVAWGVYTVAYAAAADAAVAHVMLDAVAIGVPTLAGGLPRALALVLLFAGLAAINVRGVRHGTRLAVVTTVGKMVPLLLLAVVGLFAVRWSNLAWPAWPTFAQLGAGTLVLFFAFGGVESALSPSGEIRDPARTVPRGVFGGAGAIVLLYVILQLVAQGVLGSDLASGGSTPLADVAARLAGTAGRNLIVVGTAISGFGMLAADMICTPRTFLPASESGTLPRALSRVHPRFHTPWVSIMVFAGLTLAFGLSGGFKALAVVASMALLLTYLAVCLAALRLRLTRPPVAGG